MLRIYDAAVCSRGQYLKMPLSWPASLGISIALTSSPPPRFLPAICLVSSNEFSPLLRIRREPRKRALRASPVLDRASVRVLPAPTEYVHCPSVSARSLSLTKVSSSIGTTMSAAERRTRSRPGLEASQFGRSSSSHFPKIDQVARSATVFPSPVSPKRL